MKIYSILLAVLVLTALQACKKNDDIPAVERLVPAEHRNQEGTKLLGTSRRSGGFVYWGTYIYETGSNRVSRIVDSAYNLIDGTASQQSSELFQYDGNGKLTNTVLTNGSNTVNYTFLYNSNGSVAERRFAPIGKSNYNYDANQRLLTDSVFDIQQNHWSSLRKFTSYDANDNPTGLQEWQYNPVLNSLEKVADVSITYDNKFHPYYFIDPSFKAYTGKRGAHNDLVHVITSGTSVHTRTYANNYNAAGLPKKITWTANGIEGSIDYYYY